MMTTPFLPGAFEGPTAPLLLALLAAALPPSTVASAQQPASPQIKSPVRIARDVANDRLVVSDSGTKRIRILDASMQPISSFPIDGKPLGVATAVNVIAVGNETKQAVEFYDFSGTKLGALPTTVKKPNDLSIAWNKNRPLLFVVDTRAKLVKVFPLKRMRAGTYPSQIPVGGPAADMLANPTAIAVDEVNQEIFVSDFGDAALGIDPRVQIFGFDGSLKATLRSPLSGGFTRRRPFSRPQGLAIDDGRIFLVDSWVSTILVFDRATLTNTHTLGVYGTSTGELSLPLDIVINGTTKDVYVTNNRNQRIEMFVGGAQ